MRTAEQKRKSISSHSLVGRSEQSERLHWNLTYRSVNLRLCLIHSSADTVRSMNHDMTIQYISTITMTWSQLIWTDDVAPMLTIAISELTLLISKQYDHSPLWPTRLHLLPHLRHLFQLPVLHLRDNLMLRGKVYRLLHFCRRSRASASDTYQA